jgi:hypothetical protein
MGLSSRTILNIVELVYYGPALLLALWIIKKHGLGRQSGWIYLAILAVVRIVGAATGIAANSDPSQGLIETSEIAYSIGLSPLFLAWLGIIKRVNEGIRTHSFPPRFINVVHLPILVGLVLGIVGGTKLFDTNPASVSTGVTYVKVAIMLFLVALIALSAITVFTFIYRRQAMDGEKRLVFASLAVIPFLCVRIIYSIIVDFDRSSTIFSLTSDRTTAVVVQGIMSVAMEFIVVLVFLIAGFATPAIPRSMVQSEYNASAPGQQPQQHYGGMASRDNPTMAAYPLTGAAPSYTGHKEVQEDGMTGGYTKPNISQYSA